MSEIPIIDVSGLRSPHVRERGAVAAAMGRAARDSGFLYVVNHGIPLARLHATFDAANALFDLPPAQKQMLDIRRSPRNPG